MDISSQATRFTVAVLRSLVSSPESLAITLARADMLAYVTALYPLGTREWEIKIFLHLPNRNDQRTGDILAGGSKIKVLVPHGSSQAWHGLSSRCFMLFSKGLNSYRQAVCWITTNFVLTLILFAPSSNISSCERFWSPSISVSYTHLTLPTNREV